MIGSIIFIFIFLWINLAGLFWGIKTIKDEELSLKEEFVDDR